MPRLIESPARIRAEGTKEKTIEEYVGRVSTGHEQVSVARMRSPEGWSEPPQCPDFLEITVVLRGRLRVAHGDRETVVGPGQALIAQPGETIRYHTPDPGGAEYVAICLPAFSPGTVHRLP
jgi:mannose-6-phosphate isomerase-like protein (cupin superfamily)